MGDHLVRSLLSGRTVRVVAALTTETVQEAATRHGLVGAATVALGRAISSGLLLSTLTKGEERVTLQISGDGPISLLRVDANDAGEVRGYVSQTGFPPPLGSQRRPQVAAAMGRGTVSVVRDLGLKEPYRGSASMVTGEIDEDVEAYLRESEQLDSALACEVVVDEAGAVRCAGGVLVQTLPGGGEGGLIREVQHAMRMGALYFAMAEQKSPFQRAHDLSKILLPSHEMQRLDERPVTFRCRCSVERTREVLRLLDLAELDDMIETEGRAEILCNFCSEQYVVERDALRAIRNDVARTPRGEPN